MNCPKCDSEKVGYVCFSCNEYGDLPDWIPCSERMPTLEEVEEADKQFMVTIFTGTRYFTAWDRFEKNGWLLPCVIAWTFRPAPYQPKEVKE